MTEVCSYCASDASETCSVCGKPLCSEHTRRALPFLSLGEFLGTIFRTLFTAPSTLPALLMDPGEEEVFCVEHDQENSVRRVQEQRKFLYLILALVVLCAVTIYLVLRFR
jgi:hypothetical protein